MKKEIPKITALFLIVIGVVAWGISFIFFGQTHKSKATSETTEKINFIFDPTSISTASGEFTTSVKIKPSVDMAIRGYHFEIPFDKTKIQFKSIQYKIGTVSASLGDEDSKASVINQNGKIKVVGEVQSAVGQIVLASQNIEVVIVSFTTSSLQPSSITTGGTDAKFFMTKADYSLLEVSSAGQASFSVGASSSASMSLNLKIKLQGITKKPINSNSIIVSVRLAGNGLTGISAAPQPVQFIVNDAGEWTGKADFDNVPTGGGYKVFIKGPKHIQKKICNASPTESKGGMYHCADGAIVLQTGNNTLDFSKIILLAGDLPEGGGSQNGIVDAYDTTFIRTNLGSTDASKLAIGDLNLDGIIDTQDYSMILQSLSIKFDEE